MSIKFSVALGNPPYHAEAGRRKFPIYQNFIMATTGDNSIADTVCFVTPDGFVKGGQQLEPLRNFMIEHPHLKAVEFHQDELFPGIAVDAAVTIFDNTQDHDTIKKRIVHSDKIIENGTLDWAHRDVLVDSTKEAVQRLFSEKVKCNANMSSIIPGWAPFGLNTKCYKSNKEKFFSEPNNSHNTHILVGEEQDFFWINPNDVFDYEGSDGRIEYVKLENADKYKAVFPKAGFPREKALPIRILMPGEIFTDKYLCIYADTKEEAINAGKYFDSNFYRAGLACKMTSWNLYRQWHSNLPIQNLSASSDINWNASPEEIDHQLYVKYHFTDEDICLVQNFLKKAA